MVGGKEGGNVALSGCCDLGLSAPFVPFSHAYSSLSSLFAALQHIFGDVDLARGHVYQKAHGPVGSLIAYYIEH